jgi:hypothetical protein
MTDHRVRAATTDDVAACVDLALVASAGEGTTKDTVFWRDVFARDVEEARRHVVVAVADGRTVGYARARCFEPEADAPSDRVPAGY